MSLDTHLEKFYTSREV